jgi:hypothetical protein
MFINLQLHLEQKTVSILRSPDDAVSNWRVLLC